jgi:uncharacterized membrane protein YGL010W
MKEQITINDTKLPVLISQLKSKDANYAAISKGMQIFYWALCPIYLIKIVFEAISNEPLNNILSSMCFLVAMISMAILFNRFQKEYSEVDYSQPTLLMLQKALDRYQPFSLRTLGILPGIVLIDIGISLKATTSTAFLMSQMAFLIAIILGFVIGFIIWYVQYKPIRDRTQALIDEIEAE